MVFLLFKVKELKKMIGYIAFLQLEFMKKKNDNQISPKN